MILFYLFLGLLFIAIAYPFVKWYFTRRDKQQEAQEKIKHKCFSCKKTFDYTLIQEDSSDIYRCVDCFDVADQEKHQSIEDEELCAEFTRQYNKAIAKKMVAKLLTDQKAQNIWDETYNRKYKKIIKSLNMSKEQEDAWLKKMNDQHQD